MLRGAQWLNGMGLDWRLRDHWFVNCQLCCVLEQDTLSLLNPGRQESLVMTEELLNDLNHLHKQNNI